MAIADSYTRFVAARLTPPPLTSGEPLHWDGRSGASRGRDLLPGAVPGAGAGVQAQGPLLSGDHPSPPGTIQQRGRISVPPAPAVAWGTEAASLTVYLALACVVAPSHARDSGVTGTLVWVPQGADGAGRPPVVHAALLVQPTSTTGQGACVELVPHLPADDPLRHHMELVLQTAFEAEGVAGQLYVATLADALAVHVLRRYAGCGPTVPPEPSGLAPAKLRRVTAYIAAHLAEPLALATLAAVAQLSPDHFARLFKQTTGQTPHQYVLWCRMERAKQLLAETDMPLSMIGLEVGCTDHSGFTALFRKHSAMTPKAYRAAAQKT